MDDSWRLLVFFWEDEMPVRFGASVLDSETREVLVDGRTVHVTPKAFDLPAIVVEEERSTFRGGASSSKKVHPDNSVGSLLRRGTSFPRRPG